MKRDIETLELEKMEEVNADMGGEWSILVLRVDMKAEKTLYSPEEKNYRSLISRKQDCNKSLKQRVRGKQCLQSVSSKSRLQKQKSI